MAIKFPTVHLNGTAAEELMRQNLEALKFLQEADSYLANASPHGRDYYVQEEGSFQQAVKEHEARRAAIAKIIEEITEIYLRVSDQANAI
jgi:hypothetical protein